MCRGDSSGDYTCVCGDDDNTITSPLLNGSCPYTSHPVATTSTALAASSPGTTTTTYPNGVVVGCTSYSAFTIGIPGSACIGPTLYSPAPATTSATPSASCDAQWESVLEKQFTIYGKGWTLQDGNVLEQNLQSCSGHEVKDWNFSMPPADGTSWDFMANGSMTGIDDCFGKASLSSGGCLVGGSRSLPSNA